MVIGTENNGNSNALQSISIIDCYIVRIHSLKIKGLDYINLLYTSYFIVHVHA